MAFIFQLLVLKLPLAALASDNLKLFGMLIILYGPHVMTESQRFILSTELLFVEKQGCVLGVDVLIGLVF